MKKFIIAASLMLASSQVANATCYMSLGSNDGTYALAHCEHSEGDSQCVVAYLKDGTVVRVRSKDMKIMQIDYTKYGQEVGTDTVGTKFDLAKHECDEKCYVNSYKNNTYRTYVHSDGSITRFTIDETNTITTITEMCAGIDG